MKNVEIERKFLLKCIPDNLEAYPHHRIEQGYLCTEPVIRIRRMDEAYFLTYKSRSRNPSLLGHEEFERPLTREAWQHLLPKIDGCLIAKTRYYLPLESDLVCELDHFDSPMKDLYLAEVEFESEEAAAAFIPPDWFGEDVSHDSRYHNAVMSRMETRDCQTPSAGQDARHE